MHFNPLNWYWNVNGQAFCGASMSFVPSNDAAYLEWMSENGTAPKVSSIEEVWPYIKDLVPAWVTDCQLAARPTATTYSKDQLKAYAAYVRYQREVEGVTVDGMQIPSDRSTQAKLTAAALFATIDNTRTFNWKLADGSFTASLSAAQVIATAQAVGEHVNQCFVTESQVVAQIDAGTLVALTAIDAAFGAL